MSLEWLNSALSFILTVLPYIPWFHGSWYHGLSPIQYTSWNQASLTSSFCLYHSVCIVWFFSGKWSYFSFKVCSNNCKNPYKKKVFSTTLGAAFLFTFCPALLGVLVKKRNDIALPLLLHSSWYQSAVSNASISRPHFKFWYLYEISCILRTRAAFSNCSSRSE